MRFLLAFALVCGTIGGFDGGVALEKGVRGGKCVVSGKRGSRRHRSYIGGKVLLAGAVVVFVGWLGWKRGWLVRGPRVELQPIEPVALVGGKPILLLTANVHMFCEATAEEMVSVWLRCFADRKRYEAVVVAIQEGGGAALKNALEREAFFVSEVAGNVIAVYPKQKAQGVEVRMYKPNRMANEVYPLDRAAIAVAVEGVGHVVATHAIGGFKDDWKWAHNVESRKGQMKAIVEHWAPVVVMGDLNSDSAYTDAALAQRYWSEKLGGGEVGKLKRYLEEAHRYLEREGYVAALPQVANGTTPFGVKADWIYFKGDKVELLQGGRLPACRKDPPLSDHDFVWAQVRVKEA